MKVLKRFLSAVLTAAMMMSSVGNVAYAAEPDLRDQVVYEASSEISFDEETEASKEASEAASEELSGLAELPESVADAATESASDAASVAAAEGISVSEDYVDGAIEAGSLYSSDELKENEGSELFETVDSEFSLPEGFDGMVDGNPAFTRADNGDSHVSSLAPNRLGATSDDTIYIDVTGTYYTLPADKILAQINKIRKEAYELGYVDRYVPVKWSATLEQCARIRAFEAGVTVAHERLTRRMDVFTFPDKKEFGYRGENLAWNNNHDASGITYGINQFYGEKAEYVKALAGKPHGQVGHYESMIDPDLNYVGVAACLQSDVTPYGWITVAMRLGGSKSDNVDQTKDISSGRLTYTLPASRSFVNSISISGSNTVPKNKRAEYSLSGKYSFNNGYGTSSIGFKMPAADDNGVEWKSSDPAIATVNGGIVTGVKGGNAIIMATLGKNAASKKILVTTPIEEINLRCEAIGSGVLNGNTYTLDMDKATTGNILAELLPLDATDAKNVTWKSNNTGVITIDSKGKYTLKKAGNATISASVKTSNPATPVLTAEFYVKVYGPLKAITVSEDKKKLYTSTASDTLTVKFDSSFTSDRDITFSTSDPSVFTVSNGRGAGTSEVTISSVNGTATVTLNRVATKNGEANLIVNPGNDKLKKVIPVVIANQTESIRITRNSDGISSDIKAGSGFGTFVGNVVSFEAKSYPEDAYDTSVHWESSNPYVATVDENGTVTALRKGESTITCTSDNAKEPIKISFVFRTDIKPDTMIISRTALTCYEGESYKLNATILPEGIDDRISFESADPTIAAVDDSGVVTGMSEGETTITASFANLSASCKVTIIKSDVVSGDTPFEGKDKNGIWVARQSFDESVQYTGSKIFQNNLRVYYGNKLLTEKKDYTLSYKNNVNVASEETAKSPQVTITLKGQYQGKRTYSFAITAVNLGDEGLVSEKGFVTASFNKKAQKLVPELFLGNIKLKNKTDFTCIYGDTSEGAYSQPGTYTVTVEGKGNYTGTRTWKFAITEASKNLAKAVVTIKSSDPAINKIYYVDNFSASDIAVTVKIAGTEVDPSYYEVKELPVKAGSSNIKIVATSAGNAAGFYGYKYVKLTTYGQPLNKAVVEGLEPSFVYNISDVADGGIKQKNVKLRYGEEILVEGRDYTVFYAANTKVGTAKISFAGKGRFSGSLTKSYKILANTGADFTVSYDKSIRYVKSGPVPVVTVRDSKGNILDGKTDYSISILSKSNQKAGIMRFVVVGKNNFKGYKSQEYSIILKEGVISNCTMTAADKVYSTGKNAWKSGIKITDINGKVLAAGTDYDKNLIYSYDGLSENKLPTAGTVVYVTAVGKGNYKGSSITRTYRICAADISKQVAVIDQKTYITREIEPAAGVDIHIYPTAKDAKNHTNEISADNYEDIGYTANINSGTGKVTIKGKGNYGGTKVCSFKINKKTW